MSERRDPAVDRWLDELDHPLADAHRRAREIVLGVDERITESIKWKVPTFSYQGVMASFMPAKRLLSVMFHRGTELPGEHPRFEGDGRLVRTMRFSGVDELEAHRDELEAAVRAWIELKG